MKKIRVPDYSRVVPSIPKPDVSGFHAKQQAEAAEAIRATMRGAQEARDREKEDARRQREAERAAEKAVRDAERAADREENRREREADRKQAASHHRVMLRWTIISAVAAIIAVLVTIGLATKPDEPTPRPAVTSAPSEPAATWSPWRR